MSRGKLEYLHRRLLRRGCARYRGCRAARAGRGGGADGAAGCGGGGGGGGGGGRGWRNAPRDCRAPVVRARPGPVPEWEELPEASRVAAGCLVAVLVMRMIRAGRAGPGEDGHDEPAGEAAVGAFGGQGPGTAPEPARRRLRAPVDDGAGR